MRPILGRVEVAGALADDDVVNLLLRESSQVGRLTPRSMPTALCGPVRHARLPEWPKAAERP